MGSLSLNQLFGITDATAEDDFLKITIVGGHQLVHTPPVDFEKALAELPLRHQLLQWQKERFQRRDKAWEDIHAVLDAVAGRFGVPGRWTLHGTRAHKLTLAHLNAFNKPHLLHPFLDALRPFIVRKPGMELTREILAAVVGPDRRQLLADAQIAKLLAANAMRLECDNDFAMDLKVNYQPHLQLRDEPIPSTYAGGWINSIGRSHVHAQFRKRNILWFPWEILEWPWEEQLRHLRAVVAGYNAQNLTADASEAIAEKDPGRALIGDQSGEAEKTAEAVAEEPIRRAWYFPAEGLCIPFEA